MSLPRMFVISLTVALLCLGLPGTTYADQIVIPNPAAGIDANNAFIGCGSCRFQQVYSSSQFGAFGGPRLITAIAFRPDAQIGFNLMPTSTLLQISLSTTSQAPGALNSTFAANVGGDSVAVSNGQYTWSTANTGPPGGPRDFDIIIVFTTPFLYDPSQGNLLIDFTGFVSPYLDMDITPQGPISGVIGGQANASGALVPFGLVTQVTYSGPNEVPEPATIMLLGAGLMGLALKRKSNSRSSAV